MLFYLVLQQIYKQFQMPFFNKSVLLLILLICQANYSQTEQQRKEITSNYNYEILNALANQFEFDYVNERNAVIKFARENNLELIKQKPDGGISLLKMISESGLPIYIETFNVGSAQTINTNQVQAGGSLGLSLSGENMLLGIWDGGLVRLTHQEFASRVTQLDNPQILSSHATHVSGTMIASGVDPQAKGMANQASLLAYDFDNDVSEMLAEASNGMLVSNHSYGLSPSSIPTEWFGAYLGFARNVDLLTYNAPFYLPVYAAGNSNNAFPPHNPGKNGYDLISGYNLSKNILTVANVREVSNYVDASSVEIWSSSSWGPTDDGRIKPDISAKGRLTYSSIASADDGYASFTGTSMAAPAVSGSVALLQEHHDNMYGTFLTAATLRGLVIHTAREAGQNPGPDYIFGWGLMDTGAAANLISNKNFTSVIEENTLNDGETYTLNVNAIDPNTPLVVTIAWTDPAGGVQNLDIPDDPTPRLVNDLDLKVIAPDGTTEFLPWTLDPAQPSTAATNNINNVDNVEKIEIPNATGLYTIDISHKSLLQDQLQNYSLIVSGVSESNISVSAQQAYQSFCANADAFFDLNIQSQDSFSDNINLSVSGLPTALTSNFTLDVIANEGTSTLNISNLDSTTPGEYPFTVTASSGFETFDFNLILNIKDASPLNDVVLLEPTNNELSTLSPILTWDAVSSALNYDVEISNTQNFDDIILTFNTDQTNFALPIELDEDSTYYWRVRPNSECITGNYVVDSFETKRVECDPIVFSADTPIVIPDDTTAVLQSIINIPPEIDFATQIEDINVTIDITHAWISDLRLRLTSPQGTAVTLLDGECGDLDDMNVVFDDKGMTLTCNMASPAIQGLISPEDDLSTFVGENFNGDWILTVEDDFAEDGGTINSFGIEICTEETLSNSTFDLIDFSIHPNPSNGLVNLSFENSMSNEVKLKVYNLNGKILKNIELDSNTSRHQLNFVDLNKGIYLVSLETENSKTVQKLIMK